MIMEENEQTAEWPKGKMTRTFGWKPELNKRKNF